LPISAFSKSSRKNGGNHVRVFRSLYPTDKADHSKWCLQCTNWKLSVEPSVAVGPAPNAKLAPDEKPGVMLLDDDSDLEDDYLGDDDHSTVYETGVSSFSLLRTKTSF
jgi:hypothetical protein